MIQSCNNLLTKSLNFQSNLKSKIQHKIIKIMISIKSKEANKASLLKKGEIRHFQ